MDSIVMVLFKFGNETAIKRLDSFQTFELMVDFVSTKWSVLEKNSFVLSYHLAENPNCILDNNEDFMNMFIMVHREGLDCVNINVKDVGRHVIEHEGSNSSRIANDMDIVSFVHHQENNLLSSKWSDGILGVGQFFEGGATHFRNVLSKFAVEVGFSYSYAKNEKERVTAHCKYKVLKGCPWRIHASIEKSNGYMYIRTYCADHSCGVVVKTLRNSRLSSDVISSLIYDEVKLKPTISPTDIVKLFKNKFGLEISYRIAWIGVEKTKKLVFGDASLSYDKLRSYFDNLKSLDPSSLFVLDYDTETGHFSRCFFSFGACLHGFRFCRPMLFLDGTFLTGKYKGHLLSATAKDGNQGLFPVAFAIVGSENTNSWTWFLRLLAPYLIDREMTFISDRHTGIISAIKDVLPRSHHSFCLFHITGNLKDKLKGNSKSFRSRMVFKLNQCAIAPTKELFHSFLTELRQEGGKKVVDFMDNIPFENYSNAYFKGRRYGEMSSNAAESFNSQIRDCRHLPIMELVDNIRLKLMVQMSNRLLCSSKWTSFLCPEMEKRYNVAFQECRSWVVYASTNKIFEVHSHPKMVVDLGAYTCSCGQWQQNGFPCSHAIAASHKSCDNPLVYVESFFHSTTYRECYNLPIHPVHTFGQFSCTEEQHTVLPPECKRQPGRPRKKRIPSRGEIIVNKIKCGRCGCIGNHNRRSCNLPM